MIFQVIINLTKVNNQPLFLNFVLKDLVKDFAKCLAKVQIYEVCHISLSYQFNDITKKK